QPLELMKADLLPVIDGGRSKGKTKRSVKTLPLSMVGHSIDKTLRLHMGDQGIAGLPSFNDTGRYRRRDDLAGAIRSNVLDMLVHPLNDLAGLKIIINRHFLAHYLQPRFVAGIVNDCLYCFQVPGKGPSFYLLWRTTLVVSVSGAIC